MRTLRCSMISAVLGICPTCAQADDALEMVVDYRQGLMNVFAFNVASMGDMVKGKR